MTKTLLELRLQELLDSREIGMKLGDRVFAEDRDFGADLADMMTKAKSTDQPMDRLVSFLTKDDYSYEQLMRGEHTFIERRSRIHNGLGFTYNLYVDPSTYGGLSPREAVDEIIENRRFSGESFRVYYNSDAAWQIPGTERLQASVINAFYDDVGNVRLRLAVDPDGRIVVNEDEEANYEGAEIIRAPLEAIETELNEQLLNRRTMVKLMNYIKEVRKAVNGNHREPARTTIYMFSI